MSNIRERVLGGRERKGGEHDVDVHGYNMAERADSERSQAGILSEHTAVCALAPSCEVVANVAVPDGGAKERLGEDVRMVENGRHQSVLFLSRAQGRCEHAQDLLILDSLIF